MYVLNIYTLFYHEKIVNDKKLKLIVFVMLFIISIFKNVSDSWSIIKAFVILKIYIKSFISDSKIKKILQIFIIIIGSFTFLLGSVFFKLYSQYNQLFSVFYDQKLI